jgi:hypothetical protein
MKLKLAALILIASSVIAAPSDNSKRVIQILGYDHVFTSTLRGYPLPPEMLKDMDTHGLSTEKILLTLASALEKDLSESEIHELRSFLEGPIWTKLNRNPRLSNSEKTDSEINKALSELSQKWNAYMAKITLPALDTQKKKEANQAVEPTTMRVTDPANAGSAPRMAAAHL